MVDKYPCPCENCVLFAICRTKLIDMDLKYTRIAALAETCKLLHEYIYRFKSDIDADETHSRRSNRTNRTWKLFNIKKPTGEWS